MYKKVLFGVAIATVTTLGLSFAQSVLDYVDYFGDGKSFGYTADDQISIVDINWEDILIESPVIEDEFSDEITTYRAMYSQQPLSVLVDNPELVETDTFQTQFENVDTSLWNVTVSLNDSNIDGDQIYYLFLFPENEIGELGNISNELCFVVNAEIKGEWEDCLLMYDGPTEEVHNAWGANMELANVTHTINNRMITLNRMALDGSDSVDIYLWDENNDEWDLLDNVDMLDEEYSFEAENYGSHTVLFKPDNGWTDKTYTLNVLAPDTEEVEPIPMVPETGPAENIALVLILSVIVFFGYRLISKRQR